MTTQPRMSAPIGRLRIRASEARKRRGSGAGHALSVESPREADLTEADEAGAESGCPRFYPFALRSNEDNGD
jgi:hypothetical protein